LFSERAIRNIKRTDSAKEQNLLSRTFRNSLAEHGVETIVGLDSIQGFHIFLVRTILARTGLTEFRVELNARCLVEINPATAGDFTFAFDSIRLVTT
jgi:hypothetical protein